MLDTNIWVSGLFLPKSRAGKILLAWRQNQFEVVTSVLIFQEIKRVLSYPKIAKRLGWDEGKIDEYLLLLTFFTQVVELAEVEIKVPFAPNDSFILATPLASQADYLVTGGADLLELKAHFPILSLTEFYEKVGF